MDPEIGLNIVDLGLVIEANRSAEAIGVKLTLTSRQAPSESWSLQKCASG